MTLSDLEKLDQASRSLIAGQSQSFWLWSSLLAQLRDEGFKPADPNLFVQTITTLLASQTNLSSGMSEFVTSKRRESYLAHTSFPVGESVKRELLVAPGPDNLWLIQPLREKVMCTIKEALLLSSTASLVSISTAASRGRSGASGAGGYASPLDFSRPDTSGYRKESNRYRRLSVAPLAGVERRGRGTLGSGGLAVGIPDPLPLGSHLIQGSHPFPGVCPQFLQGQSSGGRGSGSAGQGCHRAGSASISRLLQPVIRGYESFRGVETGHRPFHSELVDSADILQDGDTSIRSSLGLSGGLEGVSGLEG